MQPNYFLGIDSFPFGPPTALPNNHIPYTLCQTGAFCSMLNKNLFAHTQWIHFFQDSNIPLLRPFPPFWTTRGRSRSTCSVGRRTTCRRRWTGGAASERKAAVMPTVLFFFDDGWHKPFYINETFLGIVFGRNAQPNYNATPVKRIAYLAHL